MENKNNLLLSISILVSGVLVAGALIYNAGIKSFNNQAANLADAVSGSIDAIKEVNAADHIRGNPNAPIKIVTFEDTECPFCKNFHLTMQQIMKTYGDKVAWVYRHFPLDAIHSKARKEAVALECANELGGNEKFWSYLDKIFTVTPSNDGLDLDQLPVIAGELGLDVNKFKTCLESTKYDDLISANLEDATASGGSGTPYSIVIGGDGKKYPINGALPYEQVKTVIDQAL